jgi:DNA-binding response OmpR family regulator
MHGHWMFSCRGSPPFTSRERLVAHGAAPPVIFITAVDTQDARTLAVRAGAAGYLAKPFAGRALFETIETIQRARNSS